MKIKMILPALVKAKGPLWSKPAGLNKMLPLLESILSKVNKSRKRRKNFSIPRDRLKLNKKIYH